MAGTRPAMTISEIEIGQASNVSSLATAEDSPTIIMAGLVPAIRGLFVENARCGLWVSRLRADRLGGRP
jgi:hypothetical protein